MREEEKPRGITTFTTQLFTDEAEARAFAEADATRTLCEMGRLFDEPSEWIVMIPRKSK